MQYCKSRPTPRKRPADDALVDSAPSRKRVSVYVSPTSSPFSAPCMEALFPQTLPYGSFQHVAQPLDLPRAPMSFAQANDVQRSLRGVRPVSPPPRAPMPPQHAARVSPADVFVFQLAKTTDREAENKLSFAVKRNCIVLPPARKPRPVPGQHVLAVHGDSVSYLGQVKECRPSCVQDRLPVTLDMSRVCCQGALPPSVAYCRTFLAELRNKYHSKCTRWFGHGAMTHGHNTADGAALCTFIHEHFEKEKTMKKK